MRLRRPPQAAWFSLPLLLSSLTGLVGAARAADELGPARAAAVAPYAPPANGAAAPVEVRRDDPADAVLRRVLRSGCRDGFADVRALAAADLAPWAATVSRLCGEILDARAEPVPALTPPRLVLRRERDGRGAIAIASTLYGIWVGIATDVLFTIDGPRSAIVPPLLGMTAGLALSLIVTSDHHLDNGQAWTIITGLEYGSVNGALWAGGLDLSAQNVVGTALATGLASGALGLLVADKLHPRQGDVEVVRSGLLWGTITGLLGMALISPDAKEEAFLRGSGASMDLGFLAGLALAASFDVSRDRALIIDAGTLGGGVAGLGIAWLAVAGPNASPRPIWAGALAGMYAGMAAAIALSRDMDDDDDQTPRVAALLGRDERGRWAWGSPGGQPVFDGLGRRVVGATLTVLGGAL